MNTKQILIDIALRAFLERGYDNVPLKEIADAAGIKQASIYYHFADKHALFEACTQEFFTKWHQWMNGFLRTDAGLEALIEDTCSSLGMDSLLVKQLYGADTDAGQYRFLLDVLAYCPQAMQHMYEFNNAYYTVLAHEIDEAKQRGVIRAHVSPRAVYIMLACLLEGANIMRFTDPEVDIEAENKQLFQIIWGGIRNEQ